ncbi:MAG: MarR family transcriptional regulator [Clostridiales bacterium]|nr:MarR family transcriptional regulator [Clostridiales bacterium]
MDQFEKELNDILVETFRSILKAEEQAIRSAGIVNLSISEMHLLEAVGKPKEEKRTISDIADELNVTLPAVTVAINRLEKKGYVLKTKSEYDGRMVCVSLTKLGCKIDSMHKYFHQQMVRDVSRDLSQEEKSLLINIINRLNHFFRQKSADMEAK